MFALDEVRLALLAEGEHVHHQGRDLVLILLDDLPPFADDRFVVFRQAQLDQVAAAADALEDVLDVVGESGDGLADGRQPLGLDHGGIVAGVLDGQGRLVADGDHQLQVVLGELVGAAALEDLLGRGRGVDVDRADHPVAALHRHADRLANAHPHDAGRRVPSLVLPGVAGQHAFVSLRHVVEDRLADGDLARRSGAPCACGGPSAPTASAPGPRA